LCITGHWRIVILDDIFPCIKHKKRYQPAFTSTTSNELWVLLLEKAYAKVYGSYANIEAGFEKDALRDQTGSPGMDFMLRVKDKVTK